MNEVVIAPDAFAAVLDSLPGRLRKRLDATAQTAAQWPRTTGADEQILVHVDDETTVTLRPRSGLIGTADDVVCNCLLAPACLHRAAAASCLPLQETGPVADDAAATAAAAASPSAPSSASVGSQPLTVREREAAQALWRCAASVLEAGLVGSNLFTEAELARATQQARALGLHRAAQLGTRVAGGLRVARDSAARDSAARNAAADHRLDRFTADLRDLLLIAHLLRTNQDPSAAAGLRGFSRRAYTRQGGLRLHGLFTEPVVARTGHAGVVSYAVDDDGAVWSTASLAPGGPDLVRPAYLKTLNLGGTKLTHREFSRGGLLVSNAASSADRRLSSSDQTQAVAATGSGWTQPPVARLFAQPLAEQLDRALPADPGADTHHTGDDLLFLRLNIIGYDGGGLLGHVPNSGVIRCHATPSDIDLARLAADRHEILLIARPDRTRSATVHPLAVSVDTAAAEALALPADWSGRVNLGLDRLHPTGISPTGTPGAEPPSPSTSPLESSLHILINRVEQAVAAGRAVTRTAALDRDCARLNRDTLHTAADLLRDLTIQAEPVRDAFQRPLPSDAYSLTWLAAAVYARTAAVALTAVRWLPTEEQED